MNGAFLQVPLEEGIDKSDLLALMAKVEVNALLLKEVHAENTSCYGILSADVDPEEEDRIMKSLEVIIGDVSLENESGLYILEGHPISLGYKTN